MLRSTRPRRAPSCPFRRTAPSERATSAFGRVLDEITAWRAHLEKLGVDIEADFEWPGGGRSIYFRDPAGNCLEFAEPRIWGLE